MHSFEIEIKSLLGSKENAEKLKTALKAKDPSSAFVRASKQLNHYFNTPKNLAPLARVIAPFIPQDKQTALEKIVTEGKKVSIRTREIDGATVLFIIKASIGDDTSANGVSRIEFETPVAKTLAVLDQLLLDAGCTYQAKWSREREEYKSGDTTMTIDKNAGYGYLAEFEKIANTSEDAPHIEKELRDFMTELGVTELPQDRLERMFTHYNTHWADYYGTDRVFVVE